MPFPDESRTVLVTGATGDTGRAAVRESLALGLGVRAMVHKNDDRSDGFKKLGAKIVLGDLLEIDTIRAAMEGSMRPTSFGPCNPASSRRP
jgi:NAD(P)H dehydrogenase (quinone)